MARRKDQAYINTLGIQTRAGIIAKRTRHYGLPSPPLGLDRQQLAMWYAEHLEVAALHFHALAREAEVLCARSKNRRLAERLWNFAAMIHDRSSELIHELRIRVGGDSQVGYDPLWSEYDAGRPELPKHFDALPPDLYDGAPTPIDPAEAKAAAKRRKIVAFDPQSA